MAHDRVGAEDTLNNLGFAHDSLGHYEKAIFCFEQALAIDRAIRNRVGEGRTLNNFSVR
jgi:tetratricopeptide (TPR) repeat protein